MMVVASLALTKDRAKSSRDCCRPLKFGRQGGLPVQLGGAFGA